MTHYKGYKLRLFPTKKQEELMRKSIGCSRFVYNYFLDLSIKDYESGIKWNFYKYQKKLKDIKNELEFLKEVSNSTLTHSIRNLDNSYQKAFNKISNFPKFHSKKNSKQSFYVRYDRMYFERNKVKMEKIGKVRYKNSYKIDFSKIEKFCEPYCSYDGKYWYISFQLEEENQFLELTDDVIGIDLGIKTFATLSNGISYKNINKSNKMKKLNKKLKREQRKVSRKYELNKDGNKFIKTNNIIKQEKKIRNIYRDIANIRKNYIHNMTTEIINMRPKAIIVEDLKVSEMVKNKYLSKEIQECCFYEILRQLEYKCQWYGIEFIKADKYYPSSKTCSHCGSIKKQLSLSERTYVCEYCGTKIDRDYNASLNLMNYYHRVNTVH